MKLMVTGADGFIGSHPVEELARKECQVKAFVYYNSFNSRGWFAIPFSYHSPDTYIDTNIKGTLNVLQSPPKLGTKRGSHIRRLK